MHASGLRVSELVTLKTFYVSLSDNVLRVFGKGNKERLVPFGEVASTSMVALAQSRWLANRRTICSSPCPCLPTRCAMPLRRTC